MEPPGNGFGFHHVALRATDFDRTVRFYTEGLGFTVRLEFAIEGRIDRAVFLDMGDGRYLEVFGPASTVQAEGRRRRPDEERTEGALLHFCLRVPDTDAAYARAVAAGGRSRGIEPRDVVLRQRPQVRARIAFVTGPEGEVIEFFQAQQL